MTQFQVYTAENAPQKSQKQLSQAQKDFGFIPNAFAVLAESNLPIPLYTYMSQQIKENATLTAEEANLCMLAVSVTNGCEFCVPAHTAGASKIGTDSKVVDAIRNGKQGPNAKYNALVDFTKACVENRGWVSTTEIKAFLNAGYTKAQAMEVICICAMKTITNYASNMAKPPLNAELSKFEWKAPSSFKAKAA